jgi:hypothetical protein
MPNVLRSHTQRAYILTRFGLVQVGTDPASRPRRRIWPKAHSAHEGGPVKVIIVTLAQALQ